MNSVIFNQSSIFHLQKLESEFRKRQGTRFRLSDEEQRMELIRQSSASPDQIIQKFFRRFCHELDQELIDALTARGIVKPNRFLH